MDMEQTNKINEINRHLVLSGLNKDDLINQRAGARQVRTPGAKQMRRKPSQKNIIQNNYKHTLTMFIVKTN